MSERRLVKLSKFLSLILRHQPERFALELDEQGWASLSEVMEILKGLPNFRWACRSDVMRLVEEGAGDRKRRFEVDGDRIRARYGHTLEQPIQYKDCTPPERLYHGTSRGAVDKILVEGLKPMERQYVHLSTDPRTAVSVGSRHSDRPVILTIDAQAAHEAGVPFYQAGEKVYLSKRIPPRYISVGSERSS